jgi:biopolymer transport protein ExbD
MALSLQSNDDDDEGWLAEINTTPLVDVMLVLLIIFLLTVPVVSASVNVRLPVENSQLRNTSGDYVVISIDRAGNLYANEQLVGDVQQLSNVIAPVAALQPQPELHIRADADVPYSAVGPIIDMAQGFGFAKVGLITEPNLAVQEGAKR